MFGRLAQLSQLFLFYMKSLFVPEPVLNQIQAGATIAISVSGGKDSQALLRVVTKWLRSNGYTNQLLAIHADLGRMEWKQTLDHTRRFCQLSNVRLIVVKREKGDLLQRMQERMQQLEGKNKPFWPSAASRYCTSDLKRDIINIYLRKFDHVISVEGIRWQESSSRSKKPVWDVRERIDNQSRDAFTWNAIIDWSEEEVYEACGVSMQQLDQARMHYKIHNEVPQDWPLHPAYAYGNTRLSCAMCVLGSKSDIVNGIIHNPELARELISMEQASGFTFKKDLSLEQEYKQLLAAGYVSERI